MIGVFDSGAGGIDTVRHLRGLLPFADICYIADRKNAPYGTKSKNEIVALAVNNIKHLELLGAERVLIACCTASSVFDFLPERERKIAVPIIKPTASRAVNITENGKIGVIATEATVRSGVFTREIKAQAPTAEVTELAAQPLVRLVESGACDRNITKEQIEIVKNEILPLLALDIDTLVLGCTHFPSLERTVRGLLPGVKTVSSSKEGALYMAKEQLSAGVGKTSYI